MRVSMLHNKWFHWPGLLLLALLPVSAIATEEALVQQMRAGDAVLMLRHALAPGIGDPADFQLDDCSTQRNLNEEGRAQAKAIGAWLRARGIG